MNKFKVGDIVWVIEYANKISISCGAITSISGNIVNGDYLSLYSITNALNVHSITVEIIANKDGKYTLPGRWISPRVGDIFCSKQEAIDYVKKMIEVL